MVKLKSTYRFTHMSERETQTERARFCMTVRQIRVITKISAAVELKEF